MKPNASCIFAFGFMAHGVSKALWEINFISENHHASQQKAITDDGRYSRAGISSNQCQRVNLYRRTGIPGYRAWRRQHHTHHAEHRTESASVGLDAGGNEVITGDAKTGASQTQVRSLGELGVNSAEDLRIVFNAAEPGPEGSVNNGITLDNLVLSIFDPAGAVLFTSDAFTPITFNSTFPGTGNAGFVFALSGSEITAAQSAFGGDFGLNLVGLSASASSAAGGNETFFAVAAPPVPEPSTYAMMGAGLLGLAWLRRRKNPK